jgi:hypothetical protein
VEREETPGETGVHARESGAEETGGASEEMAMEQLGILYERRIRVGED